MSAERFVRVLAGLGTAHQAAHAIADDPSLSGELVRTWTIITNDIEDNMREARSTIEAMEANADV